MRLGSHPGAARTRVALIVLIACLTVIASIAAAQDKIGIYFDPAYGSMNFDTTSIPESVTAYLVLSDPTASGGVGGWECRLTIDGPAQLGAVTLAGQSLNILTPPQFMVGVGDAPLPPAQDVLLAELQLFVTENLPVTLGLKPVYIPSIPGQMAYLNAADMVELLPMAPVSGQAEVATINGGEQFCDPSVGALLFGEVPVSTTATRTLRVDNPGLVPLVLDIGIAEPTGIFWLPTISGVQSVPPGASLSLPVNFTPAAIAAYEGELLLGTNCPPIPLTGTGRAPIFSWTVPELVSFETTPLGGSASQDVTIANTGEIPLYLNWALVDPCEDFWLDPAARYGFYIQPGSSWTGTVNFSPQSIGDRTCTISLGETLPAITLEGSGREPIVSWNVWPTIVGFTDIAVGETAYQNVRITNTGEIPLDVDIWILDDTLGFFLPNPSTATIGPGHHTIPVGTTVTLRVGFTPAAAGLFETELLLGDIVGSLPLRGTGVVAEPECYVFPSALTFGPVPVGVQESATFQVMNTGNATLTISPSQPSPHFYVSAGPFDVPPGSRLNVTVSFRPHEVGVFETLIDLGDDLCSPVACSGQSIWAPEPDQNQVGLFFDENFGQYEGFGPIYQPFDLYLALLDCSSAEGVGGWECRLTTSGGEVMPMIQQLAGQALNVLEYPSFMVGTGVPLLPVDGDVLLATFTFMPLSSDPIYFQLHPTYLPTIEGEMAWLTGDMQQVWPMYTHTGVPDVAVFNPSIFVGNEAPPPAAATQGRQVTLSWERPDSAYDACRVMRRQKDEMAQPVSGLLPNAGSALSFTDDVTDFAAGVVLYYSYGLYVDGHEVVRSSEVEVTVPAAATYATGLLPNVPNPFNPQTEVRFELEKAGPARVVIFDVQGRKVRTLIDESLSAGPQSRFWYGKDDAGRQVPSGAYYVRLDTDGQVDTRKILLLK